MSLLSNISRLFVLRVISQVGNLLLFIYFTRVYSAGSLGQYFYFESVAGIATIFAALGTSGAAEKFLSEDREVSSIYSSGLLVTVFLSLSVGGILLIVHPYITSVGKRLSIFITVTLFFGRIVSYLRHVLRAEQRAAVAGYIQTTQFLIFAILSVLFSLLQFGPVGIILAAILSRALLVGPSLYLIDTQLGLPSLAACKSLFSYGKYYTITILGTKIFYFADIALIGVYLTTASVGYYEISWRLILASIFLNSLIAETAFAYISESHSQGDLDMISQDIRRCLVYVLAIPLGVVGGAYIIGPDLLKTLFTAEYVPEPLLISVLAVGFVFQALYHLFSRALYAIDRPQIAMLPAIVAIVLNVSLNILLIPRYGILGAAIATTLSYFLAGASYFIGVVQFIEFRIPIWSLSEQLISATIMGLILSIGNEYLHYQPGLESLIVVVIGFLIYTSLLFLFPTTRKNYYEILPNF